MYLDEQLINPNSPLHLTDPFRVQTEATSWIPLARKRRLILLLFYYTALIFDFGFFFICVPLRWPDGPTLADKTNVFGWHLVYMTNWGGILQTFYFLCAIIDYHIRNTRYGQPFHRHRDRYFTLEASIGSWICIGFWCLLFPGEFLDEKRSFDGGKFADDFAAHGVTSMFLIIELLCVPHRFADNTCRSPRELITVALFGLVYMIWNLACYAVNGVYAYQAVQSLIPVWADFMFYPTAIFTIVLCYYLSRWLTFKRWGATLGRHSTAMDGDAEESDVDSLLSDTANSTFDPFEPPPALLPLNTTIASSVESGSGPSPAASSASTFGWSSHGGDSHHRPTHKRNRSNQHAQPTASAFTYDGLYAPSDDTERDRDMNLTVDAVSLQPYRESLAAVDIDGTAQNDIVEKDHVWHA